jgi:hypothetical protein
MIANRNKHLSREVSAFLAAVKLVLEMYTCGTVLGEELRELDDCRETSVTAIVSLYTIIHNQRHTRYHHQL